MTKNPQPDAQPAPERGETFFQVLFSWPNVLIVVIIGVIALVVLFYAEENWRGQWMWNKYRKGLEASGENLDFKSFVPPMVANEENFAETPLIRSWFPRGGPYLETDYTRVAKLIPSQRTNRYRSDRSFMDLVAWEMAFDVVQSDPETKSTKKFQTDKLHRISRVAAAPAILKGLESSAEVFSELREASRRPYARYPITYDLSQPWGILLPHLAPVKKICSELQLKACAELALGQSAEALDDTKLAFHLADSLRDEPFLICQLVRIACVQIALQPVWEGLAEHRWSDAQLQELDKQLLKFDFVNDLKRILRSERADSLLTVDLIREDRNLSEHLNLMSSERSPDFDSAVVQVSTKVMPSGWFYQEQIDLCRFFQARFQDILSGTNRFILPGEAKVKAATLAKAFESKRGMRSFAARNLLPDFGNRFLKFGRAQIGIDEAVIACALERYRITTGNFPETTEELVPRFLARLPSDVLTGSPYKYRRETSGFVLYSVGWNETDNNGVAGKTYFDEHEGDWVWHVPGD